MVVDLRLVARDSHVIAQPLCRFQVIVAVTPQRQRSRSSRFVVDMGLLHGYSSFGTRETIRNNMNPRGQSPDRLGLHGGGEVPPPKRSFGTPNKSPARTGPLSTSKRPTRARYLALAKGPPALLRVAAPYVAASFASREASAPSWPARLRAPAMPNRYIRSTWFTPFDPSTRDSLCRSNYMQILRPPSAGCKRRRVKKVPVMSDSRHTAARIWRIAYRFRRVRIYPLRSRLRTITLTELCGTVGVGYRLLEFQRRWS